MKGGKNAQWNDEDMADHFLEKARMFIARNKSQPFFLYYAMQQPHVPRTPHPRFAGSTGMGPRGDTIAEADWCVGELLKTLDSISILQNTLIIFTSDNGPVVNDGYYDEAEEKLGGHSPAGNLRGGKYSLFEAGTRVPFITYWQGTIKPKVSEAMVCQIDFLSSLAALTGQKLTEKSDSENHLKALLGKTEKGRNELILEANSKTAFRQGDWVLIPPYKGPAENRVVKIELGNSSQYQLYNLREDIGQHKNLADSQPKKLKQMKSDFQRYVQQMPETIVQPLKLD